MSISFSASKTAPASAEVQVHFLASPFPTGDDSGGKSGKSKAESNSKTKTKTAQQIESMLADASGQPSKRAGQILAARGFTAQAGDTELYLDDTSQLVACICLGNQPTLRQVSDSVANFARTAFKFSAVAIHTLPTPGAAAASSKSKSKPAVSFADTWGFSQESFAQAVAEGLTLGSYQYSDFKSKPKPPSKLSKVTLVAGTELTPIRRGLQHGAAIGEATCWARDLVNEPGGSLTPEKLAAKARKMAQERGLKVTVWDLPAIKARKLGGLLGVNRGSDRPARFVKLEWSPPRGSNVKPGVKSSGAAGAREELKHIKSVAFVGKGVTFDAGGLSIKTAAGMKNMKYDMSGAAAVLGAMAAIAAIQPRCKVTAYVPMTDNMLGGDATRPGDVLTMRNKKTVEVLNTDAEGRLILADALSLAGEDGHDAVIDLATLTGACVVALGNGYAGVMGNDQHWVDHVLDSGGRAGERLWQLPLPDDYRAQLDSPVADLANIGSGNGGTITAGLFLSEFVRPGARWAHLDIAGTAFSDKTAGVNSKGGTGFGVRTLVQLARSFDG